MSDWRSTKARRVLAALLRIGGRIKRQSGSHKTLSRPGWTDYVFAFHDNEEIGPRMLTRIAKSTAFLQMICNYTGVWQQPTFSLESRLQPVRA